MPQDRQRGMRAVRTAGRAAVLAVSLALGAPTPERIELRSPRIPTRTASASS